MSCLDKVKSGPDDSVSCFYINMTCSLRSSVHDLHLIFDHYRLIEENPAVTEALSLFPKPKALLGTVIQVATSSNRVRVSYKPLLISTNI